MTLGTSLKNSIASSTLRPKTSATDLPLYSTSNTCCLNRLPPQASHGRTISAMSCISILTSPSPRHTSQRPPSTLQEDAEGSSPDAFAAGRLASTDLTSSQPSTYVTGLEREDLPIGF